MLSVVIPTLNAAQYLSATIKSLGAGDVIVVDGDSTDDTVAVARGLGARIIQAPRGRGVQLKAGADAASGTWLLFLHADTRLGAGWRQEVDAFIADGANQNRAAVFRFQLDDDRMIARYLEWIVRWRCRLFGLPYGDQGLLISADFYTTLGGFNAMPLMEDVDIIRRIGCKRLVFMDVPAITSAARYERGYISRMCRNGLCLWLYFIGVPVTLIAKLYR